MSVWTQCLVESSGRFDVVQNVMYERGDGILAGTVAQQTTVDATYPETDPADPDTTAEIARQAQTMTVIEAPASFVF